ncbi:hypothetical protein M9458_002468, partial [Cirrhinus mrigala]
TTGTHDKGPAGQKELGLQDLSEAFSPEMKDSCVADVTLRKRHQSLSGIMMHLDSVGSSPEVLEMNSTTLDTNAQIPHQPGVLKNPEDVPQDHTQITARESSSSENNTRPSADLQDKLTSSLNDFKDEHSSDLQLRGSDGEQDEDLSHVKDRNQERFSSDGMSDLSVSASAGQIPPELKIHQTQEKTGETP